ncbi:MAG: pirin family protein [Proteobacteria bacterium]|nr:pirin family protein [Pseudomonadota bacterium]
MKQPVGLYHAPAGHWVGDGFPVRSLFSYDRLGRHVSPFLLFDYAGPQLFDPTQQRRGVGAHPHRGFETVSIVYGGGVAHRDSAGNGGVIGPGDVQWMTAGSGLLHEEFHSEQFAREGGLLEMVQLWVNLPASAKSVPPRYQTIVDAQIPVLGLPGGAGQVRLIAGEWQGQRGPADTHTPLWVWDVALALGAEVDFPVPAGWNVVVALLHGELDVGASQTMGPADMALFDASAAGLRLKAKADSRLVLLAGEPIDEPIVGYGPFVMNTRAEIEAAFADYHAGVYGQM